MRFLPSFARSATLSLNGTIKHFSPRMPYTVSGGLLFGAVMSGQSPIDTWLSNYVNSAHFSASLESAISTAEPKERAKLLLELLSYVAPKVKGVDPLTPDQLLSEISITYSTAKAPPKGKPKADK